MISSKGFSDFGNHRLLLAVLLVVVVAGVVAFGPESATTGFVTGSSFTITAGTPAQTSITVSWSPYSGADKYYVHYKRSVDSYYSYNIKDMPTATSYTISGLQRDTSYDIKVNPYKSDSTGQTIGSSLATSNVLTVKTAGVPPLVLTVGVVTDSTIPLTWPAVEGASNYNIKYKPTGASSWAGLINTNGATSATISGLIRETSYDIHGEAIAGSLIIKTADLTGIKTGAQTLTLTAGTPGFSSVPISWNSIYGASYFKVEYRKTGTTSWSRAPDVNPNNADGTPKVDGTKTTIYNLDATASYDIQVSAVSAVTNQVLKVSNIVTAKTGIAPTLTASIGTPTSAAIPVNWNAYPDATSYTVKHKKTGASSWAASATVTGGFTSYLIPSLEASTSYVIEVGAIKNGAYLKQTTVTASTAAPAAATAQTLSVTKSGDGTGSITSNPTAVNCGTTCSASIQTGTSITLTATPASDSAFSGWSGDCTGTSATCTLSVTAGKSASATFTKAAAQPTTVTVQRSLEKRHSTTPSPAQRAANDPSTVAASYAGNSLTNPAVLQKLNQKYQKSVEVVGAEPTLAATLEYQGVTKVSFDAWPGGENCNSGIKVEAFDLFGNSVGSAVTSIADVHKKASGSFVPRGNVYKLRATNTPGRAFSFHCGYVDDLVVRISYKEGVPVVVKTIGSCSSDNRKNGYCTHTFPQKPELTKVVGSIQGGKCLSGGSLDVYFTFIDPDDGTTFESHQGTYLSGFDVNRLVFDKDVTKDTGPGKAPYFKIDSIRGLVGCNPLTSFTAIVYLPKLNLVPTR